MAAKFVRIPYGTRMKFPEFCPFTGQSQPRGRVLISRGRTQLVIPVPFVGLFRRKKVGRISFPAVAIVAWGANLLTQLALLAFIGSFLLGITVRKEDQQIYKFLIGGWLAFFILKMMRWLCLSRVRIVRVGTTSLEVRFASEQYAGEFARLNGLHVSDHRAKKRLMPVMANDVRRG